MKKHSYLIILLATMLIACHKYDALRDDINGNLYLRGRVFINTIATTAAPTPLTAATVEIGYAPDTTNYLYTVPTDANGYFVFNDIEKGKNYVISVRDTAGGVMYYGKLPVTTDTSRNDLQIIVNPAQSLQNGIVYTVVDQAGKPVGSCSVCLFTSLFQYHNAMMTDSCIGGSYLLTTNAYGMVFQIGLPADTIYTFFRFRAGTSALVLRGHDTSKVQQVGITYPKPVVVK